MSHWYKEHASFIIISHTFVVASATWLVSSYIIDENKINLYKAKAENAETISETYQAKIQILELEIENVKTKNKRYLSWLTQEPKALPFLEKKIKALQNQLKENKTKKISLSNKTTPKQEVAYLLYEFSKPFVKGESFIDPKTKATIGISALHPDYTASGVIQFPGNKTTELKNVKPGSSWEFEKNGTNYKMTLETVNFLNDSIKASVMEIEK